ncbi:hypothetical protein COK81_20280 [Bacillus thuringiensis]|uniref:Uncharacterized protein n=1 Tax=Bacillus thuringiensis TaxID=1428 RepID=A0A9X7AXU2_BACTU|nr:hypothetical protein [Bacillus thuringiensis]PFT87460.1 hypothetical protein COK81_20280 [Bacillus thuringiensis]
MPRFLNWITDQITGELKGITVDDVNVSDIYEYRFEVDGHSVWGESEPIQADHSQIVHYVGPYVSVSTNNHIALYAIRKDGKEIPILRPMAFTSASIGETGHLHKSPYFLSWIPSDSTTIRGAIFRYEGRENTFKYLVTVNGIDQPFDIQYIDKEAHLHFKQSVTNQSITISAYSQIESFAPQMIAAFEPHIQEFTLPHFIGWVTTGISVTGAKFKNSDASISYRVCVNTNCQFVKGIQVDDTIVIPIQADVHSDIRIHAVVEGMLDTEVASRGRIYPPDERFEPGEWFLGATPPNYDGTKPPIVFVQGRNGKANNWFGETVYSGMNTMYEMAYNAGYRTAFVQLFDADGKGSHSIEENGFLLAGMLEAIYAKFQRQKVTIVAHSKGGLDTQAALVLFGASRYVGNVITLSSPHYGSQLADVCYSWWGKALASMLNERDAGTYDLQTAQMKMLREKIDNSPNRQDNIYYTLAGTGWGPKPSMLYVGGLYLYRYDQNDGLVTVKNAQLPYGNHVKTGEWNHDSIRTGTAVFHEIQHLLKPDGGHIRDVYHDEPMYEDGGHTRDVYHDESMYEDSDYALHESQQMIFGGVLKPNHLTRVPFEVDEQTDMTVVLFTNTQQANIEVISPTKKKYRLRSLKKKKVFSEMMFHKSHVHLIDLKNISPGTWEIRLITSSPNDSYLAMIHLHHTPMSLLIPHKVLQTNTATQRIQPIQGTHDSYINRDQAPIYTIMRLLNSYGNPVYQKQLVGKISAETIAKELQDVPSPGMYNLTIDVKQHLDHKHVRHRTFIKSIKIDK